MEPKLPAPERPPVLYEQKAPETAPVTQHETVGERGVERQVEQRSEVIHQEQPVTPVLPPPIAAPVPLPSIDASSQQTIADDAPLVAADEELIEKEWVDKAKKIVEETKDDPYRREQEVGKLQADYLRKRYGKELGTSS